MNQNKEALTASEVFRELKRLYPEARCSLDYDQPHELLIATILSAQCTDERVNIITSDLFTRYRTVSDFAGAKLVDVESLIHSAGFFRQKAKSIIGAAKLIESEFGGEVPQAMDELLRLPGVARKTANVVLSNAFNIHDGIAVDTHVKRLSQRMGLTQHTTPETIEKDLKTKVPKKNWGLVSHLLIYHGRAVCNARNPHCSQCSLELTCPKKDYK